MSVVLVYHSVVAAVGHPWLEVRPQTLADQLDWISDLGYRWATVRETTDRPAERLAAVTFDDGLTDFRLAAPVLKRRRVPVTHYVCAGLAGATSSWTTDPSLRSRPLLGPDELRDLAADGVEFGCHGWTHQPFVDLAPEGLGAELDRCLDWFHAELSLSPGSLAYPYGRCDAVCARVVAERFDLALAVEPVANVPARLCVPRLCCADDTDRRQLEGLLARYDLADRLANSV